MAVGLSRFRLVGRMPCGANPFGLNPVWPHDGPMRYRPCAAMSIGTLGALGEHCAQGIEERATRARWYHTAGSLYKE